jgi:hypothetical protein
MIFQVIFFSGYVRAQEKISSLQSPHLNSINIYIGVFEFNINYERSIIQHQRSSTGIRLGFGPGAFVTAGDGFYINPALVHVIGKRKSHLEFDLGLKYIVNYFGGNSDLSLILVPDIFAGYRYEKPEGKIIFRFGLNYPTAVNIGVGFKF